MNIQASLSFIIKKKKASATGHHRRRQATAMKWRRLRRRGSEEHERREERKRKKIFLKKKWMFSAGGVGRAGEWKSPQKKTCALSINLNPTYLYSATQLPFNIHNLLQLSQVCVSSLKPTFIVHLSKNELVAKDYHPKSIFLCTTFGCFSYCVIFSCGFVCIRVYLHLKRCLFVFLRLGFTESQHLGLCVLFCFTYISIVGKECRRKSNY